MKITFRFSALQALNAVSMRDNQTGLVYIKSEYDPASILDQLDLAYIKEYIANRLLIESSQFVDIQETQV